MPTPSAMFNTSLANYTTLTAMLTPALFMTANGSLIISTSNRMSRIVDRIRALNDLADRTDRGVSDLDFIDLRRDHYDGQLRDLAWRSDRIRLALTTLYFALTSFIVTSLVLAVDVLLGNRFSGLPTFLAVVGVVLMFVSSMNLTFEAHRALKSNRDEVDFFHELRARRHADRGAAVKT